MRTITVSFVARVAGWDRADSGTLSNVPAPRLVDRPGDLPAPDRPVTSRALTRFDAVTTRAWSAIIAEVWVAVVGWVLVVGTGFDSDVQLAFATCARASR